MGQDLMNPPSVEGWHTGKEWIDTGILVERVNFAASVVADPSKPGIRTIVDRLRAAGELSPEDFLDPASTCVGPLPVRPSTRDRPAQPRRASRVRCASTAGDDPAADERVTELLQLIVAAREYQFM